MNEYQFSRTDPFSFSMKIKVLSAISVLASTLVGISQGTFQDLDFEQASIVQLGPGISAASAFPGWQTLIGAALLPVLY